MSSNKKTYQSKSLQQTIPTLKHYSYSKITPNNQSNPQQNQIPTSSKTSYALNSEQKSNKEINKYNNSNTNNQKKTENNNIVYVNKNNKFNVSKNDKSNNDKNYPQNYNSRSNDYVKINSREKYNINNKENTEKNKSDFNNKNKINSITNKTNENDNKIKIKNRNNIINKIIGNNLPNRNRNINKDENKFNLNLNLEKLNLNKSYEQKKETKYIPKPKDSTARYEVSRVNNNINNNKNNSYYIKNKQKNNILISDKNKINPTPNIREAGTNNSRNKNLNDLRINKNKSYSSGLNIIQQIPTNIEKKISYSRYNIPQNNKENKKTIVPHYNYGLNKSKERSNPSQTKAYIYIKTENITNNSDPKNKYPMNTISTYRRNSFKKYPTNNNNDSKSNKKFTSYTYVQKGRNEQEIKEKEVKKDNNGNIVIIPRKEEKIYLTKKPEIITNLPKEKENNNVSISYISNIHKSSNKKNNLNSTENKYNNGDNNQSNNNSITYIKSSNKKEEKNNKKIFNKITKFEPLDKEKILKENKKDKINIDNIGNNISIDNNINTKKDLNLNNNNNEEVETTPIKKTNISIIDNFNETEINKDDNNINNNLIENPNKIRKLNSTEKLEQKIKDLESKLDDLNNNTISFFNTTEEEENNDNKDSILNKPGLSEISKEYLSINLDALEPKNELSDFSRAYMIELYNYDNLSHERPQLSGLTKEYLRENEEIKEEKDVENN